jgi:hypothetical protein
VRRGDVGVLAALAVVVGVVGFRLGAGDGAGALAAAVGGCPAALVLALAPDRRRAPPGPPALRAVRPLAGTVPAELLRLGAALHRAALEEAARSAIAQPGATHPAASTDDGAAEVARALVAAAPAPLPGVSDLDGAPGSGLRGVVSGLRENAGAEPVVVAHAVLAGPPGWLAGHGVDVPPQLADEALLVAWDGSARGALAVGPAPVRAPAALRAARLVGGVAAAAGAVGAPLLAAPAVVPLGALLVVAGLRCVPRRHPIGATSG